MLAAFSIIQYIWLPQESSMNGGYVNILVFLFSCATLDFTGVVRLDHHPNYWAKYFSHVPNHQSVYFIHGIIGIKSWLPKACSCALETGMALPGWWFCIGVSNEKWWILTRLIMLDRNIIIGNLSEDFPIHIWFMLKLGNDRKLESDKSII